MYTGNGALLVMSRLCVCIFLFFFVCPCDVVSSESAPFEIFIEKALSIANTNRESIRTWKGSLLLEQNFFDPLSNKSQGRLKAKIDFAVDVVKGKQISISRLIEDEQVESDGVSRKRPLRVKGFLIRDGLTYEFDYVDPSGPIYNPDNVIASPTAANADPKIPYVMLDNTVSPANLKGNLQIKPGISIPTVLHFPSVEFFSPFDGLSLGSSNDCESLKLLIANIDALENFSFDMKNDSKTNTTVISIINNSNPEIITEYTLDVNGLCIRRFNGDLNERSTPGRYEYTEERTYKKVSNVWIPDKIRVTLEHAKWSYEYTFAEQQVNVLLDDDVFSLKTLGVMQGDFAKDMRTGTSYEIKDPSLSVRDFTALLTKKTSTSFRVVRYSFIIVGAVIILVALFCKFRRWLKSITGDKL